VAVFLNKNYWLLREIWLPTIIIIRKKGVLARGSGQRLELLKEPGNH